GPRDREAEARKEAGVGIGLADDLRSIRTALIKAHLAGDFEASFDLALFQMGRAVFAPGYHAHALDVAVKETPDRPNTRMNDADFAAWSPGETMLEDRSHLSLQWLEIDDDGESFAALRALPQAEKEALFAASVARTVKGQLAFEPQARPELEATVARLDIDFAAHVRPTADMLWSRINKGRILDIARTVFGVAWAAARSKYKKPALAEAMEAAFAAGDRPVGIGADAHAAALAWMPPGFAAFDTGGVHGDADGDTAGVTQAAEAGTGDVDAGSAGDGEAVPDDTGQVPADPPAAEEAADRAATAPADEHSASPDGNGSQTEAAAAPADGEAGSDIAGPDGIAPPAPVNGHDAAPDPMAIPEFLRRVH
ncbi:MAG: hypothetical protein OYG32_10660, partial [Rhodospirillaceae bacterium]|nr:hypothetical protein [Rhodospirillaceae bacterium]